MRPCSSKWMNGRDISFDSCGATLTSCHNFTSTSLSEAQWFNYTETLGVNEYCVINVDASQFLGRVVIDGAVSVGVEYDGYDLGEVIDVEVGTSMDLIIYNSDNSQATTFNLGYSSSYLPFASSLILVTMALGSALALFL